MSPTRSPDAIKLHPSLTTRKTPTMSIRITRISEPHETVLHIAGRLMSEDVGELTKEFQGIDGPVTLNLAGLQSAAPDGVATLLEIASLGAELRGASSYIELLLKRNS